MNREMSSTNTSEETIISWNDARIRLVGDYDIDIYEEKDEDSDDELSQEMDCLETFSFRFPHPDYCKSNVITKYDDGNNDKASNQTKMISIELKGFDMESGNVWSSTGVTLWRASGILCDYFLKHHSLLKRSKRVLELGAGLGLCGILAHHITSSYVCLTDGDSHTLQLLRSNIQRNITTTTSTSTGDGEKRIQSKEIACHQLLWGRQYALDFLERQSTRDEETTFDIIIGSDIIYAECILQPLWETIKVLLTKEIGIFIMAFSSGRQVGPISNVLDVAENAGFSHKCVMEDYRKCQQDEGVSIYLFRWKDDS